LIHFIDYDAAAIERNALEAMQEALQVDLGPGDERRIFLQTVIQFLVSAYACADDAARQNLLRYARGSVLDAIGERTGTVRLQPTPARATLEFTLSATRPSSIHIALGTRATADGQVFFQTIEGVTIPPGSLKGYANAESILHEGVEGHLHNGIGAGQISNLVDPIPFVQTVTNTEPSIGGSGLETDDHYRDRIRLAPTRYSTAGPSGAYEYYARGASADILDASATTPGPGKVLVTALLPSGYQGAENVLESVLVACNDRDVRPLTDHVTVAAAEPVAYDIDIRYFVPTVREAQIVDMIESPGGIIDQYVTWQEGKLGRDVNPDQLRALCLNVGVIRLEVAAPTFASINNTQVGRLRSLTVAHEVIA